MVAQRTAYRGLVDQYGSPLVSDRVQQAHQQLQSLRLEIRQALRAKYDAAHTGPKNEEHWSQADYLDPHAANSLPVRRKLRSRSRYEVVENNPYLKGSVLTLANDFVGSGPKPKIRDDRFKGKKDLRKQAELDFWRWSRAAKIRPKLWRTRLAKLIDGEAFLFAITNDRLKSLVKLDFRVVECDQVSSPFLNGPGMIAKKDRRGITEVDGIRFDDNGNVLDYHLLRQHPGSMFWWTDKASGDWIAARNVIHWFRQDRGWLRGVPETTPSLPLCALLRRYTLAVVRTAEIGAAFSAILETEGPPNAMAWPTDEEGNPVEDNPFDVFPIDHGLFTTMPWGYKMKQLETKQPTQLYDSFVNALLREILRPILIPFNLGAGTSKDSNMASGVLDTHIYQNGQTSERYSCEEEELDPLFELWWEEYRRVNPQIAALPHSEIPPDRDWGWPPVGLDHTDPQKVWGALDTAHSKGFLTDRDIQEGRFNRDVDDWREEIREDLAFRKEVGLMPGPASKPTDEAPEEDSEEDPQESQERDQEEEEQIRDEE